MLKANSIFISYRRNDSNYVTGCVYEKLRAHFGMSIIFKDTHSIPLGSDFRQYIAQGLSDSQVLIAVIGSMWVDTLNQRLVEGSQDWVREELETALDKGDMPVIPLLIDGAPMPREQDLPESLKALAFRNAAQVRPALDFDQDLERLIKGLEDILNTSSTVRLSRGQQLELSRFRSEIVERERDYKTVERQLNVEMDGPTGNKLEARLAMLVEEIEELEQKISTLEKGYAR